MAIDLVFATSPFILGASLEIAVLIGLFILRVPAELAIIILIPFNLVIVGFYMPQIIPIIALVAGLFIGFALLKVVRR